MSEKIMRIQASAVCVFIALTSCGGNSGSDSNSSTTNSSISPVASSSSSNSSTITETKVTLHYGTNSMQVGELRLPKNATAPYPLVIIIHGGCWVTAYADYHFMDNFSDAVTQIGYATWNIEYRAIGTGGEWPVIFEDVGKAVDYSKSIAMTYPIDIKKVAVIGHSAGGHLALWAASRAQIPSSSTIYTANPLALRGALSIAGIANVTEYNACYSVAPNVIGDSLNSTNRLKETSPYHMLPIATKTVLISGTADGTVPSNISADYTRKANELGSASVHYDLQGLGHFDLINPERTNWSLYQQSLQEFFKD